MLFLFQETNPYSLQITQSSYQFVPGLKALYGLPITKLNLDLCCFVSDSALELLCWLPLLTDLSLKDCYKITRAGLECLAGLPLTKLSVERSHSLDVRDENVFGCLRCLQINVEAPWIIEVSSFCGSSHGCQFYCSVKRAVVRSQRVRL